MKAPVTYIEDFLTESQAELAFNTLLSIAWVQVEGRPRREYWTSDRPYTYGSGLATHTYQPQEWPLPVSMINQFMVDQDYQDKLFNACFLNRYDSNRDHLGWHADDSPEIDPNRDIAVVTLGSGREINFRKMEKGSEIEKVFLKPGSLLLMHGGMQQTHLHKIPKSGDSRLGTRISLTYRGLI